MKTTKILKWSNDQHVKCLSLIMRLYHSHKINIDTIKKTRMKHEISNNFLIGPILR